MRKRDLHEQTLALLKILKEDQGQSQKDIAMACNLSPVDISKAKNPKEVNWNEISLERWQLINTKLQQLVGPYPPGQSPRWDSPDLVRRLRRSATLYGVLAGVLSCLITVLFKDYIGFQTMATKSFYRMIPILFVIHTTIGAAIGFLVAFSLTKYQRSRGAKWQWLLLNFTVIFVLVTLLRGLTARDATFIAAILHEEAAGLLGAPNFELMATALAFALGSLLLTRELLENRSQSIDVILYRTIWLSFCSALVYVSVYALYLVLTTQGWLIDGGYWRSPALFDYSFSHPERLPWVWLFLFLVIFGVWHNINAQLEEGAA